MTRSTLEQALGFDIPLIVPIMLILYIAVIMVVGLWAARLVRRRQIHGTMDHSSGTRIQFSGWRYVYRRTAVRLGGRSLFSLGSSRRCVRTHLEFRYHRQENEKIYRKSQSTDYS